MMVQYCHVLRKDDNEWVKKCTHYEVNIVNPLGLTALEGGNSGRCWWHSIMVRTLVSAGELSLSCARLLAGWVTTLWLSSPLSVSQHGQLSHPSLRGR